MMRYKNYKEQKTCNVLDCEIIAFNHRYPRAETHPQDDLRFLLKHFAKVGSQKVTTCIFKGDTRIVLRNIQQVINIFL